MIEMDIMKLTIRDKLNDTDVGKRDYADRIEIESQGYDAKGREVGGTRPG